MDRGQILVEYIIPAVVTMVIMFICERRTPRPEEKNVTRIVAAFMALVFFILIQVGVRFFKT